MRAELEHTPSTCSSSYSFMDPELDAPSDNPGPILATDSSLPSPANVLVSLPRPRSPPARGTAAQGEFHIDTKTRNLVNIKQGLMETQTVSFETMVKMFLVRSRINASSRADIKELATSGPALMQGVDAEYRVLCDEALAFCNLDIGKSPSADKDQVALCKYVKLNMRAFCNATVETDRHLPIVNILNTILSLDDGNDAIFIRNDPMVVESVHFPNSVTKRKPDVVLADLEAGKKWLGVEESCTFQQCREAAGDAKTKVKGKKKAKGKPQAKAKAKEQEQGRKGKGKAEVRRNEQHDWNPIQQFLELKMRNKLNKLSTTFSSSYEIKNLTSAASGAPEEVHTSSAPVAEGSSTAVKRPHSGNLENPGPTKRARRAGRIMPPFPLIPGLDDDVQCAYYAIELLRVSWTVSHASGILLKDELLEILWYDPQGCIKTTPINIVKELPLLVVLIRAQQRSKYISGLRKTAVPGNFDLTTKAAPRFQLVGRMSSLGELKMSTAPSTSTHIGNEDEPTHFFKSSWPEDVRPREHEILIKAAERVEKYLPDHLRHFVLDHLPTISSTDEIYDTSTAIIRILLGLSPVGARTQYLMCSDLLSNLLGIADNFTLFKEVLHDVVRAHRLLWVVGIAHGDVSFHNIMMKDGRGVLNDFDLASIMEPGATSPSQTGIRRTGTLLFMSVDLLHGDVPRLYRHDLESFAWILLYASVCVKDGEENLDVEPFRDWVSMRASQLEAHKTLFLNVCTVRNLSDKPKWLLSTFEIWYEVMARKHKRNMPGPEEDPKLLGDVLRAWGIGKGDWENFSLDRALVQESSGNIQDSSSAKALL